MSESAHRLKVSVFLGRLARLALVTTVMVSIGSETTAQSEDVPPKLPFKIELGEPFTFKDVPGLHSFAHAYADVDGPKWLFLSGRTGGLHGFRKDNFPVKAANHEIWVVDIRKSKVWSLNIDDLAHDRKTPADLDVEQWKSTNALSCQVGDQLYIMGGYGYSSGVDKMVTFDRLTVMNVKDVIDAVMNEKSIWPFARQYKDSSFQIAGGGLQPLDGKLVAVFGQSFDGSYTVDDADTGVTFTQVYTNAIKIFDVRDNTMSQMGEQVKVYPNPPADRFADAGKPAPPEFDNYRYPEFLKLEPYHRRDLNVLPAMSPKGTPRIAVYGGVFRPGEFAAYLEPVYIDKIVEKNYKVEGARYSYMSFSPGVDRKFQQLLSQYKCASLQIHEPRQGMFSIFFGGISNYRYDRKENQLIKDPLVLMPNGRPIVDSVPFEQAISGMVQRTDGTSLGFILPVSMPGYSGTEARLLVAPGVPRHENGVVQLDKITGPTQIGHIYGGIRSLAPYSGQYEKEHPGQKATSAYNMFIPVTITPIESKVIAMPPIPKTD